MDVLPSSYIANIPQCSTPGLTPSFKYWTRISVKRIAGLPNWVPVTWWETWTEFLTLSFSFPLPRYCVQLSANGKNSLLLVLYVSLPVKQIKAKTNIQVRSCKSNNFDLNYSCEKYFFCCIWSYLVVKWVCLVLNQINDRGIHYLLFYLWKRNCLL